jgi:hypothetical protein
MPVMTTPTTAEITDHWRRQMQARLDRASRRFANMEPLLSKNADPDPVVEAANAQSVGDDFSHVLGEMKNVIHYFWEWCDATGGKGDKRLKGWVSKLKSDEQTTMVNIAEARNCDVHRAPVDPQRRTSTLHLRKPGGARLILSKRAYFARFEFKDGRPGSFWVGTFCRAAFPLLQRLINEFDQL